jgi:N-dimethylarginine dimethylaminohydrolase
LLFKTFEEDVGVELESMVPVKGLPDLVFTANAGVLFDKKGVISQFLHPERKREEE